MINNYRIPVNLLSLTKQQEHGRPSLAVIPSALYAIEMKPRFKRTALITVVLLLLLLIALYDIVAYDFHELPVANQWVISKVGIVLAIIILPFTFWLYFSYLIRKEKPIKSKAIRLLKSTLNVIILSAVGWLFLYAILSGSILITNRLLGEQRKFHLNGVIEDYQTQTSKGTTRYYIKVLSDSLNRPIELKVKEPYQIGQRFEKDLYQGYWGLLYSDN